jgi:hypothetical protein
LCLAYDDLLKATVTIHDTLAQYLDAKFPAGNTTADSTGKIAGLVYRREKHRDIRGYRVSVNQPDGPAGVNDPDAPTSFSVPGASVANTAAVTAATMPEPAISTKTTTR